VAHHVAFLLFVALAVYAQSVTGFALALILLGLVGATEVVPLADTVNAVNVMVLTNSVTVLWRRRAFSIERALWPALAACLGGGVAGTLLAIWLADSAIQVLRLLLGLSIAVCALMLWRAARPLKAQSPPRAFVLAGTASGLLGGMFSAPGPPLVYLLYRQPWPIARIQESLILFFGMVALLRLALVVPTGEFSLGALRLAAEAIPVVLVVSAVAARRRAPLSPNLLRNLVCVLLVGTGAGMVVGAASALQ
jgi:uncharacterized membrane protein YfcA